MAAVEGSQFDLPRAISLGGASFKAYEEPKPVHCFEDFDVNDTTVLILDRQFLRQAFWGVLEVKLLSATNVPAGAPGGLLGAPCPYAVVSVSSPTSLKARTRPYKATSCTVSRNPTWDPDCPYMLFPVRDPATDELRIELYDATPNPKSNFRTKKPSSYPLGTASLRLSEVLQRGGAEDCQDRVLTLQMPSEGPSMLVVGSTVSVSVRLRPMDAVAAADPHHLDDLTTVKTLPMSWDAPMQIGLDLVEWYRGKEYQMVTWQYLKDVVEAAGARVGSLHPVAFIANRSTETEAWVFCNMKDRRVVVAFRGTNETADWLIDLWVVPTPDVSIRPNEPGPADVDPAKIRVHRGFLQGYNSVRLAVLQMVDEVLRMDGSASLWKVELTGHSLGGALATLASYDIAWNKRDRDQSRQPGPSIGSVAMVTFGAPRVGNDVFARDFNAVLPDAWRFHNLNDSVSSVPFSLGFWNFTHVGKDVELGLDGEIKVSTRECQRSLPRKVLSATFVSSHLEFRYKNSMLRIVRNWINGRPQLPGGGK